MFKGRAAGVFGNNGKTETAPLKEKIGDCMQGLFPEDISRSSQRTQRKI
jgi:hypothetical protein